MFNPLVPSVSIMNFLELLNLRSDKPYVFLFSCVNCFGSVYSQCVHSVNNKCYNFWEVSFLARRMRK